MIHTNDKHKNTLTIQEDKSQEYAENTEEITLQRPEQHFVALM